MLEHQNMATIRLINIDGCKGAFYCDMGGKEGEVLHTRTDLFHYNGGFSWGYLGTGCQFLAHSIAGKVYEGQQLTNSQICSAAQEILNDVVSKIDGESDHVLKISDLIKSGNKAFK